MKTSKRGAAEAPKDADAQFELTVRRVALAAMDEVNYGRQIKRNAEFLSAAARLADHHRADTLLCALSGARLPTRDAIDVPAAFHTATKLRTIVLEVHDRSHVPWIEVWRRNIDEPHRFRQRLAMSSEPVAAKAALMAGLPTRSWGSTLCLACGETNIVSTKRAGGLYDPHKFMTYLRTTRPQLILNPCHTYMTRHEMKQKRVAYSKAAGGRAVLSVWNRVRSVRRQAELPWHLLIGGKDHTASITEMPSDLGFLRLGVVDLQTA